MIDDRIKEIVNEEIKPITIASEITPDSALSVQIAVNSYNIKVNLATKQARKQVLNKEYDDIQKACGFSKCEYGGWIHESTLKDQIMKEAEEKLKKMK